MIVDLQPTLANERVILVPLHANDFDVLYSVAADPDIWRQHPNKDRWQKEVFQTFFHGALQSGGAFRVVDRASGETIGSTRYYDYRPDARSIFIGYTFYARSYWGKGINPMVKAMMLDYIFQLVDHVYFHIGSENIRSQVAIGRLGAVKIGEEEVCYFGEAPKLNFTYKISKVDWERS